MHQAIGNVGHYYYKRAVNSYNCGRHCRAIARWGGELIGASLSEPHSYVETYVKMVGWSMHDKQRRKTGMQYTSVVW